MINTPVTTSRLVLRRPRLSDVPVLFEICSDPRVWTHLPSARHVSSEETDALVRSWLSSWEEAGLGTWTVRTSTAGPVIGYGGSSIVDGTIWNLGYRLRADEHGRGYATEIAGAGLQHARATRPNVPVIAYMLERNPASQRVAQKLGLSLVHRGPDRGNPDRDAVRLVYSDRPLQDAELTVAMR